MLVKAMTGVSRQKILQITAALINISRVMTECTSVNTLPPIYGMACQPFECRNIRATNFELCTLAFVQKRHCEATIYDKASGVCMLMNDPCFSLKSQFDHVYRSVRYECAKWIPHDESRRAYWYIEENNIRSYVSRRAHKGDVYHWQKDHEILCNWSQWPQCGREWQFWMASDGTTLQRDLGKAWFN